MGYNTAKNRLLELNNCELKELQQQIIEKDKKIKVLEEGKEHFKSIAENIVSLLSKLNKELPNPQREELNYEKCISDTIFIIKEFKQSQNSKAIEVLENLKKEILNIDKSEIKTLDNGYSTLYVDRPEVIIKIDNQITELRGGENESE